MKTLKIKCPNCKTDINLDDVLMHDFKESIKKDLSNEYSRKETEFSELLARTRTEIREQTKQESLLQIKTKEKLIEDLKDQLSNVQQKLENNSQQLQGEVQELALEEILSDTFATDLVQPVAKGVRGADCMLHIRAGEVQIGSILFESKRVKNFSSGFIDKLKKDNLQAKCQATVIVTSTLPKGINGKFGVVDGVWVCLFEAEAIKQLTLVLRFGLLKVFEVTQNQKLSGTKAEKLFQYLTSNEFKNLMENVLKGFQTLEESFQEEKKRLTTLWKIREAHLQEVVNNVLELYGSVKGMSSEIPEIQMLNLKKAS